MENGNTKFQADRVRKLVQTPDGNWYFKILILDMFWWNRQGFRAFSIIIRIYPNSDITLYLG